MNVKRQAVREYRFKQYREISCSGAMGLVSFGLSMWLLDVSRSRIKALIYAGRLETERVAGQRLITFASLLRYSGVQKSGKI